MSATNFTASSYSQVIKTAIHKSYLVVDGVKFGENNSINEARLLRHGVVCQSLIELYLRTQGKGS